MFELVLGKLLFKNNLLQLRCSAKKATCYRLSYIKFFQESNEVTSKVTNNVTSLVTLLLLTSCYTTLVCTF